LTSDRWQHVKGLFESALALAPTERTAFLNENCTDPELREEVESLLESHDETGQFLESPVAALDSFDTEHQMDTAAIGMRVGPWELVEELGRGGMGTVYLAVRADQEFRKRVAIKLIRRGMESEFAVRRFRNERQILAKLEHPNIARLIDGGTTRDGMPYFVMEYVEGQPLQRFCEEHALSPGTRIEIFLKVCSAVHYAHRRMVVHRDLKPGNILVKKDGTPKLLDFGIAKLLAPETSESVDTTVVGARIVTPAYASPEQMRGEPATVRSDIYALGVVLFELLTGRRPSQDPSAFEELEPSFRRVISKATRQKPEERYESVETFSADIQRCVEGQLPAHVPDTHPHASPGSVAVLPFRVLKTEAPSDEYLGIGITDALVTKLSNVGRISVRPTSAVMRYTETHDAAAAGRELSVEYVVEGRVQKAGDRVRATVQLVRVKTGTPVWASNFDEDVVDLLKVEDSISGQVANALIPQLTGEEKEQLARRGTLNPKAHQAYLRGRWYWSQHTEDGRAKALISFMQAIAEDPRYAQAHAGVADYYTQLGAWGGLPPHESFAAAKQAATTALEIDHSLAEAHASLAFALWAYDRDYGAAAHEFQLAIALNPDYATAHHWFGLLNSSRGRHEVAIASLERARKLDPNSPILAAALSLAYYNAHEYDHAIVFLRGAIQSVGEVASLYEMLGWCYLAKNQVPEALEAAHRAVDLSGRSIFGMAVLAQAEAANGNRSVARDLLAEVESRTATRYNSGYLLASMYLACGDRRGALDHLEQAWVDRDWWINWLGTAPRWDDLRSEPRFIKLMRGAPDAPPQNDRAPAAAPDAAISRLVRKSYLAAIVAVMIVMLGVYFTYARAQRVAPPFQAPRVTKLTTNGTAQLAAISPDGAYVTYTMTLDGRTSLYARASGAPPARLAGPFDGPVTHLEFTRRGTHIAYVANPAREPGGPALYVIPLTGGTPEMLMPRVEGPLSISPDGARVAFLRANAREGGDELLVAESNGTGEKRLAMRKYPDRFVMMTTPAWSLDGTKVACGIAGTDAKGYHLGLRVFDAASGKETLLRSPRFLTLAGVTWVRGRRGLMAVGKEPDASFLQIWYVPLGRGQTRRITNDLIDYAGVSVASDAASMVSVQKQVLSNIYVMDPRPDAAPVQITPGSGRYFDLAWSPDGKIGYASDASGLADIWIIDADGSGQRQLTSGNGRSYSPSFSPDGQSVAFHSNRSGNWNIWKMSIEGRNAVQLTFQTRDSNWPSFTPDGSGIVYHHSGPNAMFNVWRVPAAGGAPVRLSENRTTRPAVSPVDGRIACWFSDDGTRPRWRLAVLPPGGGAPERLFEGLPAEPDLPLRWTPKGDGIAFVRTVKGVQNIWVQPVNGSPARPLTNFVWGDIFSFAWSRDGRLAFSRGMSTSDVVLIRD
jgi:serine/threonine protein kinase/Tol biopolymer transport system component/tetratricopeptide (TPR) repeat protein